MRPNPIYEAMAALDAAHAALDGVEPLDQRRSMNPHDRDALAMKVLQAMLSTGVGASLLGVALMKVDSYITVADVTGDAVPSVVHEEVQLSTVRHPGLRAPLVLERGLSPNVPWCVVSFPTADRGTMPRHPESLQWLLTAMGGDGRMTGPQFECGAPASWQRHKEEHDVFALAWYSGTEYWAAYAACWMHLDPIAATLIKQRAGTQRTP